MQTLKQREKRSRDLSKQTDVFILTMNQIRPNTKASCRCRGGRA
jgi:hypothetical protein